MSVMAEAPPAGLLRTFEFKLWIFKLFMPEEVVLLHSYMAFMYCGFFPLVNTASSVNGTICLFSIIIENFMVSI